MNGHSSGSPGGEKQDTIQVMIQARQWEELKAFICRKEVLT